MVRGCGGAPVAGRVERSAAAAMLGPPTPPGSARKSASPAAAAVASPTPTWSLRRGACAGRRSDAMRARRAAGAPTAAPALRTSASARSCSSSSAARSGDDASAASTSGRRSESSDPSASAASSMGASSGGSACRRFLSKNTSIEMIPGRRILFPALRTDFRRHAGISAPPRSPCARQQQLSTHEEIRNALAQAHPDRGCGRVRCGGNGRPHVRLGEERKGESEGAERHPHRHRLEWRRRHHAPAARR